MPGQRQKGMKHIQGWIDGSIYTEVEKFCQKEQISISKFVGIAAVEFMSKFESNKQEDNRGRKRDCRKQLFAEAKVNELAVRVDAERLNELLDEIAEIGVAWKKMRDKGVTPRCIKAAMRESVRGLAFEWCMGESGSECDF